MTGIMFKESMESEKHSCKDCESRSKSLFCALEGRELDFLDQNRFQNRHKAGQYLFYSGNPGSGIYCVMSGTIKLESLDENGKSHLVQIFSSGSLLSKTQRASFLQIGL